MCDDSSVSPATPWTPDGVGAWYILHSADATGQAIQKTLAEQVKQHSRIRVFERFNAIDLICKKVIDNDKKECIEFVKVLTLQLGQVIDSSYL